MKAPAVNAARRFAFATIALCAGGSALFAQSIVAPSPSSDSNIAMYSSSGHHDFLISAAPSSAASALYQYGDLGFRPHATYSLVYADSLKAAAGQAVSTYIDTYALGLLIDNGEKWSLDYTRSDIRYSNHDFRDSVGQQLTFGAKSVHSNWGARLSQNYSKTDAPNVETGRQSSQETSETVLSTTWSVNEQISVGATGAQTLTFLKAAPDVYSWSVAPGADYHYGALTVGGSVQCGYLLIYRASDIESVRPAAHVAWQTTQRTSIDASAGWDDWKMVAGSKDHVTGGYYQLGVNYHPAENTFATLSGQRGNSVAPLTHQLSKTEQWSANLRQRLLKHFQLTLGASDQQTRYIPTNLVLFLDRKDRLRNYDASISTTFLKHCSGSVYYRFSKNASNIAGFGFSSHQIGFEIGIRY